MDVTFKIKGAALNWKDNITTWTKAIKRVQSEQNKRHLTNLSKVQRHFGAFYSEADDSASSRTVTFPFDYTKPQLFYNLIYIWHEVLTDRSAFSAR